MFDAVVPSIFKCFKSLYVNTSVSNLFNPVKVTELSPVWVRAASSVYHLQFYCLLKYVCSSFSLTFGISFGF